MNSEAICFFVIGMAGSGKTTFVSVSLKGSSQSVNIQQHPG